MKKLAVTIALIIVFIIIYMLELNFFSWFTIAGVKPNLLVIFILFIGLYSGAKMGTAFGIIVRIYSRYLRKCLNWTVSNSTRNSWIF